MKYLTHPPAPSKPEPASQPTAQAGASMTLHGQKPYDYLFVTISNQQFQDEYSHRILINNGKNLFGKQKGDP